MAHAQIDVYLNGGEEYVGRRSQIDPRLRQDGGYGAPSFNDSNCYTETAPSGSTGYGFGGLTCSGQTQSIDRGHVRVLDEAAQRSQGETAVWPAVFLRGPKRMGGRRGPRRAPYVAPHGIDNMFMTSFRYYLP